MAEGGTLVLLPDWILDEVPPIDEIVEHARHPCYNELGEMLRLDNMDLSNIKSDLSASNKLSAVYHIWLDKKGKGATRRRLLKALRTKHVGQNNVAEEYEKKLIKMAIKETKRKQSIENRQSIETKLLIPKFGKMRRRTSNERNLKLQFNLLLSSVYDSIERVDVKKVKFQVQAWLITDEKSFESLELSEYRRKIKEQTSSSDIILFLMEEDFFNYHNPQLLEEIVEVILRNDEGVKTKMTQYMKDYKKSPITLEELEQVSHEDGLGAKAPSGLPQCSFEASPNLTLQEFQTTISSNIPQSNHMLLESANPGSIIMTYVALPCVASAVMKHLTNPIICEKLKSKGVRVIKPCPDAHFDNIETTIEFMNISDPIDNEMDNSEQLSLTPMSTFSQCVMSFQGTTQIGKTVSAYSFPLSPSLTKSDDHTYLTKCCQATSNGPSAWVVSSGYLHAVYMQSLVF